MNDFEEIVYNPMFIDFDLISLTFESFCEVINDCTDLNGNIIY